MAVSGPIKELRPAVIASDQLVETRSGNAGVVLAAIFALALAVRLAFNLWLPHINNFAACDAYEYIQNAHALIGLAQSPATFWQDCLACLAGTASVAAAQHVSQVLASMKGFAISGPIFPAYLAVSLVLSGAASLPDYAAWPHLLVGQSIMSAAMCVFIALAGFNCFGRRAGIAAGLLAALYPGFIVNSGRLYSESFACVLLSALIWMVTRSFRKGANTLPVVFLTGVLSASLQLSRSVMAVVSLAMLPLTVISQKKGPISRAFISNSLIAVLVFAVGFCVPALPWLGFQKLAFGGGGLVVDRVGRYNFFVGNNIDTGGWLSYPYPDGRGVESRSFGTLFKEAVSKSPQRWIKLLLDKPARLFKFPWNDFKTAVGPVNHEGQVIFHQLLLLCGALGVVFCTFCRRGFDFPPVERSVIYARSFVVALFLFHCIYFFFITVPRYNLTAMPELIVFAGAGFVALVDMIRSSATRARALSLVAAIIGLAALLWLPLVPLSCAVFPGIAPVATLWIVAALKVIALIGVTVSVLSLAPDSGAVIAWRWQTVTLAALLAPLLCFPIRANGRWYEWSADLDFSHAPLRQTLNVPIHNGAVSRGDVYVMFDASGVRQFADGLSLRVNGISLNDQPVIAGMSLAESFDRAMEIFPGVYQREGERQWDMLTASAGLANSDLRQWCLVLVPQELVTAACARAIETGSQVMHLEVELSNSASDPFTVFGAYKQNDRERTVPSVDLYSWEKCFYGVENARGLTDTRFETKISSAGVNWSDTDLAPLAAGRQSGACNFAVLLAPGPVSASSTLLDDRRLENENQRLESNSHTRLISSSPLQSAELDAGKGNLHDIKISAPALGKGSGLMLVRLRGKIHSSDEDVTGAVVVGASFAGHGGSKSAVYKSAWTPRALRSGRHGRDFEVVVPLPTQLKEGTSVSLGVTLSCAAPEFGLKNVYRPVEGTVRFEDMRLDVFELAQNPLGLGHMVY